MQGKGRSIYVSRQEQERKRRNQIRSWIILVLIVAVAALGFTLLRGAGKTTEITANILPCYPDQDVTVFGNNVLYYDDASIYCLTSGGAIRWSFPVGAGASFSVSDTHVVAWNGTRLCIIDQNGTPSYDEAQDDVIQFARIGGNYCAVVLGEDTKPTLLVKNLTGSQVDYEKEAFNNLLVLDAGFYGDQGQYMWTLSMDVFGTNINTVLNTFQVGKMNTGVVSLGDNLAYRVVYDNGKLRVFTTQQMYSYDYKGVQDASGTKLVYGWQLIDSYSPERGDGYMLLTPAGQVSGSQQLSELRLLSAGDDRRFALPSDCVGAVVHGNSIYGFCDKYIYRSSVREQRFFPYSMPLEENITLTGFHGMTSDYRAIVTDGKAVYSITVPQ